MSKKKLAESTRATFTSVSKALTDILTAVPEKADVINGAIASLNTSIAGLDNLNDDEAAAGPALAAFDALTQSLLGLLNGLRAEFAAQTAALPGKIEAALNAKLTSGEFVAKDKVDVAVNAARSTARADYQAELAKVEARKGILATNGIPACDAALAGTDEEFNARVAAVKPRVEKFKALNGIDLSAGPVTRALFADEETFKADFAFFETHNKGGKPGGHKNPLASGKAGDKPAVMLLGV